MEQITGNAETKLHGGQISERHIVGFIMKFAEALADFKKANADVLAITQDPNIEEAEYYTKVTQANDQLDVLYEPTSVFW